MAAAVDAPSSASGPGLGLSLTDELLQYDKIIALRDDVFAGSHPRLKLTPAAAPLQASEKHLPDAQAGLLPGLPNGVAHKPDSKPQPTPAHASQHDTAPLFISPATPNGVSGPSTQPAPPSRPSPKIDPIFLQKSDELVKAEMRLERQRIERGFEDQIQKKGPSKRYAEEENPDFDVSEVLNQAHELIKHLPPGIAAVTNRAGSHSDSVEEATYYSSQVNDTATDDSDDRVRRKTTKPCKFFFEGSCRKGDACTFSHDPAFRQKLQALPANAEHAEFYSAHRNGRPVPGRVVNGGRLRPSPVYSNREDGELIEDSPYSPSLQIHVEDARLESHAQHESGKSRFANRNEQGPSRRNRRSSPMGDRRGRASPEVRDGKVVRNHITSPLAPQPSRVSPLAVARIPRLERLRQGEQDDRSPRQGRRNNNANQSPNTQPQNRKRRREFEVDDSLRNVAPRRYVESPAIQIKEEPVSPPPFHDVPAPRPAPREEVVRVPVEYVAASPRQPARVIYEPAHPDDRGYVHADVRRISSPSVRRVVSGSQAQYEPVNGQAVRRIVSARYPDRASSSFAPSMRDYQEPPSTALQPPLRERTPHMASQEPRTYRAQAQQQQVVYRAPEEPTSPDVRRIRYSPIERQGSVAMPPPARRIVMDQDGNRYYEAFQPSARPQTVREAHYDAPLVSPQEGPIQRVASVRPQTARVISDGRYVQRIPSPEPQYVEYRHAVPSMAPPSAYEPQERTYRDSRGELVHLVEYPPERREVRYVDPPRPQEIIRVQSVAPRDPGYEMAARPEYVRMPNMQARDPRDAGYDMGPVARMSNAPSVPPDAQPRIVELGRTPAPQFPREAGEGSMRPPSRFVQREQYVEAPRTRYRYVSDMPRGGYEVREDDRGSVMEEVVKENRRPVQRV